MRDVQNKEIKLYQKVVFKDKDQFFHGIVTSLNNEQKRVKIFVQPSADNNLLNETGMFSVHPNKTLTTFIDNESFYKFVLS